MLNQEESEIDEAVFEEENVRFFTENSEDLKCFKDGEFDRILCNLSLMIVPDPSKMLASLFRTLQKSGKIALSVWVRKSKMKYFTFKAPIFRSHDIFFPPSRSNFHLNDRDRLIKMF